MGTSLAALSSKRSLYPIETDTGAERIVEAVVGFRRTDGVYELRRALTSDERRVIETRKRHLVSNLEPARAIEIKGDILEMLSGFGGGQVGADEAAVMAAQYATVMAGMPAWAVRRACGRWARGEVTPEEIGEKKINRSFAPSSAQLRIVAEQIVRPHTQEVARLSKTLRAEVPRPEMSDAEREAAAQRIRAKADETIQKIDEQSADEVLREAAAKAGHDHEARARNDERIKREYADRGLPIPDGPLISLDLRLRLGWRIEQFGGETVLVKP